jgi:hypothetical protein
MHIGRARTAQLVAANNFLVSIANTNPIHFKDWNTDAELALHADELDSAINLS